MDQRILDFLNKERVCALTICLSDGQPHSASMHFWIDENPFYVYFLTSKKSKKFSEIGRSGKAKASVVLGFNEEIMIECQMDGEIIPVGAKEDFERLKKIDISKNPHHEKFYLDENIVMLRFNPIWWKYTESKSDPKVVISSEDKNG